MTYPLNLKTYETRCRGHSKNVRSLFDSSSFYKKKAFINFLRWGGAAPDPVFTQWYRVPNELPSLYTKLKTTQATILVNTCVLEVTHIFAIFC